MFEIVTRCLFNIVKQRVTEEKENLKRVALIILDDDDDDDDLEMLCANISVRRREKKKKKKEKKERILLQWKETTSLVNGWDLPRACSLAIKEQM